MVGLVASSFFERHMLHKEMRASLEHSGVIIGDMG